MNEILNTIDDINEKLKYLYYQCQQNHIDITVDLNTIHYALNQKIKVNVEDRIIKAQERKHE